MLTVQAAAAGGPGPLQPGGNSQQPPGGLRPAWPPAPDVQSLMPDEYGALMWSEYTLQLVKQGETTMLDAADVEWHITNHNEEYCQGGEAAVHIVRWHNRRGVPSSWPIAEGEQVALKVYRRPDGKGGLKEVLTEGEAEEEARIARRLLRKEVNALDILRRAGCTNSIPELLGVFQRTGSAQELPLFGYAMRAYRHGSLNHFLLRTCDRLVSEREFAAFFSSAKMAAHYSKLHDVLSRLGYAEVPEHLAEQLPPPVSDGAGTPQVPSRPRRRGLLLQDISSNNLLLKEMQGGCELLFCDPTRAELMDNLERAQGTRSISATWVWGSMAARERMLDEGADVYSLNMCMLELWAVAEGTPVALAQLVHMLRPGKSMDTAVNFMRALCTAMLKQHAIGSSSCGIVPRVQRELPLSWLMLWAILLGCDDFQSKQAMDSGRRHRRPSVADMADVAGRLNAVAEQMESLEGGMTEAALEAPAGAALVQDCVQLYSRLAALTRLDDPKLLPADSSLRWVATRFLQQEHPLVAAMARQGGLVPGPDNRCAIPKLAAGVLYFHHAVMEAQKAAKWESVQQVKERCNPMLMEMCQEYRELQLQVLRLVPPGSELAQFVRDKDASLPANMNHFMQQGVALGILPPLLEPSTAVDAVQLPAVTAAAAQPPQPCTAGPASQLAQAGVAAVPGAQLAGGPAVPASPLQQPVPAHAAAESQHAGVPGLPAAAAVQPLVPASGLAPEPGAHAWQPAAAHPLGHGINLNLSNQPSLPNPSSTLGQPAAAAAGPSGTHAVPASAVQQPVLQQAMPAPQHADAPAVPAAVLLLSPSAFGPPLGAQSWQTAAQMLVAHSPAACPLGQVGIEQPGPSSQPTLTLLQHQLLPSMLAPAGLLMAIPASLSQPAALATQSNYWPMQLSAGFGIGASPHLEQWPAVPSPPPPAGSGVTHAAPSADGAAGGAGAAAWPWPGAHAEIAAVAAPCQPESPTKKRKLGPCSGLGRAASAPPQGEGGTLKAAAQLHSLGAGAPSASCAASPAAAFPAAPA